MINTQLPFGAERKITFHELHSFFDAQIVIDGDQQMEVVGHHHEIVNGKDTLSMIERSTSMKRVAMRSDWSRARPPCVLEVTKKVRLLAEISSRFAFREGMGMCRRIVAHS